MTKEDQYRHLCEEASECRECPLVFHKLTYLNQNNGSINSPLMFIGEAPGFVKNPNQRLKAFYGNQSGWNFEHLLKTIGLDRDSVFVTNALLHTPIMGSAHKYDDYYGFLSIRPPSLAELKKCSSFLKRQMDLVDPKIICTLGRSALDACFTVFPGFPRLNLFRNAAKPANWDEKIIFPLYHTSPNVTSSFRSLKQMEKDFQELRNLMNMLGVDIKASVPK